jgi:predicted RecA/RadA family phage recombinase
MAAIALVTANRVRIVESIEQMTLPAVEAITAGMPVRIDATTGKFTAANGTDATEARIWGVASNTAPAGLAVTAVRRGVLDGFNFDDQDYGDLIYLSDTDGTLADANGTVNVVVGRVIPGTGVTMGTAYDKLLHVSL